MTRKRIVGTCECDDCIDSTTPCDQDCPLGELCQGCKLAMDIDKDEDYEKLTALGRY